MIWPPRNGITSNVTPVTTLFVAGLITDTVLEPRICYVYRIFFSGDVAIETGSFPTAYILYYNIIEVGSITDTVSEPAFATYNP